MILAQHDVCFATPRLDGGDGSRGSIDRSNRSVSQSCQHFGFRKQGTAGFMASTACYVSSIDDLLIRIGGKHGRLWVFILQPAAPFLLSPPPMLVKEFSRHTLSAIHQEPGFGSCLGIGMALMGGGNGAERVDLFLDANVRVYRYGYSYG